MGCVIMMALSMFIVFQQMPSRQTAAAGQGEAAQVPILMYHSILKNPNKTGEYVITPDQLKSDLEYLQEHGYQTVVMQDLIDYVQEGIPLPEKPVMLTFDDGHLNNITYAEPLLDEYHMRAVLSIVGQYTDTETEKGEDNPAYSYLTWEQVKQARQRGFFEIQNHSNNMHSLTGRRKGALPASGENTEMYQKALLEDLTTMQQKIKDCTGVAPSTFTYPFGLISKHSSEILRQMGFQATLTCEHGINYIEQGNPNHLFGLKRILRSGKSSTQTIMKELSAAP